MKLFRLSASFIPLLTRTARPVDFSHIITCGSDGDVRIWNGIDDDEPTSHRVGERAHAIAFSVS